MNAGSAESGFEGFYRANFTRLVNQVQGKKRIGFHDAEDIVQASLAELASQWEQAENPDALLATIIRRKTIRYWGQQPFTKGVAVAHLGEEAERLHSRDQDPAVSIEHRDTLRYLTQELNLEPIEQDIILGRAHGLSTTEIASKAEVSADRVRQVGRRLKQRATAVVTPIPIELNVGANVMAHVNRLPPRQREVVTWAIHGYQPASIAKVLGITANNARVNLSHARRALATMDTGGSLVLAMEAAISTRRQVRGQSVPWAPRGLTLNRPRSMPNAPRDPVSA